MSAMRQILKSKRIILFLATVAFMLYGFGGMFMRLRNVFSDPIEDMSFGWLVPMFSLYVLWTSRREIKESVGKPSILGLLACLPCIAVALVGTRGLQLRLGRGNRHSRFHARRMAHREAVRVSRDLPPIHRPACNVP